MIRIKITILFLLTVLNLAAQDSKIRFRHINIENGLSSNTVWSIVQDNEGFMWFGTNDGLNKYDGYNFTVYRRKLEDSLSLSSNGIIDVLVGDDGNLWIGTSDGLNFYSTKKNQFQSFGSPASESLYIRCLFKMGPNRLWVGSSDGLYQFDINEKEYVTNGSFPNDPFVFLDRNITNITEDNKGTVWLSTTEGLYVLGNGVISKASVIGSHPILSAGEVFRDVLQDSNGDYWIATESTDEGVFHFDSEMNLLNSYSNIDNDERSLVGNRVRVIKELSDEKVWFGTFDGISVFDSDRDSFFNCQSNKYDLSSLSYNSVRDIFEDLEGGIWVATYSGGINYFHPGFQKFNHVKEEPAMVNSLSNNQIWSFAQESNGNIWIGTDDGLNYLDISTNSFDREFGENLSAELLDKTIKSLAVDKQNRLWVGNFLGLSLYNYSNHEFQHFVHNPLDSNSIGYGHVHAICEDREGQIWVGTNGGGLNRFNPDINTFDRISSVEHEPNEIIDLHITSILDDDNEFLWIVTEAGLELFDKKRELFTRTKLRADKVYSLFSQLNILSQHLDSEGNLWIGTRGDGLYIYNTIGGDVNIIKELDGLPSNTINSILHDDEGEIWISTNYGISKLKKPKEGWDHINETHIVNFNITDGLQGSQFYPNSMLKSQNGQLYFGGTNGYNSFYPNEVKRTIIHPKIVFTDLRFQNDKASLNSGNRIGEKNIPDDTITIKSSQSNFSIEFAALNYFDPGQTTYAYKLDPVDDDWNIIGNDRVVNYSKLPPGEYIFNIKATNNMINWGTNISQLSISVLPPIWRTWWAYFLYLVTLIILLYIFFIISIKWGKLKSNLEWEHREREKDHELHQMRIKFFTDISHELRTPLTLILAPLERLLNQYTGSTRSKNQLQLIQRNGERMLHLINQLLDLRKLETGHLNLKAAKGNIVKFMDEISLAFKEITSQKNINYKIQTDQDEISIWFDRDKMEIILYNLLSNAVKYTPTAGNIGLSLSSFPEIHEKFTPDTDTLAEGHVEIRVEDDGIGIPSENLDKIFDRFYRYDGKGHGLMYGSGVGLEIVKKFVDLHKGSISVNSIESTVGQRGKTIFTIKLPMGKSHLSEADIIEDFRTSEDISLYKHSSIEADVNLEESRMETISSSQNQYEELNRASLLIVEDNDDVRKFIVNLFVEEYKIVEASNGEEGVKQAFDEIPDMIISDIMMPGIDGIELCKKIKTDNRTSHIPVILLTARTAVTFQIEGIETGADDYITKPFSSEFLKSRVKKLIEQRQNLRMQSGKGFKLIPENISVTSVDENLMEKTINYINEHIADPDLGVEKVAKEVGMSRGHFYRKIKALTNLSAVEFIKVIRLERAAKLLKTGKLNISEVRYAVGFNDADYFRESFKIHFGVIPSDYE